MAKNSSEPLEKDIQDQIRKAAEYIPGVQLFRANVGGGWQGKYVKRGKSVYIANAHWFNTGLPTGFPDLFGYRLRLITPDMVGKTFAEFFRMEVKRPKGDVRDEQLEWDRQFIHDGVPGGFVRSVEEAIILMRGGIY